MFLDKHGEQLKTEEIIYSHIQN